jgi:galactose oxidase
MYELHVRHTLTSYLYLQFCPGISLDFNGRVIVTGGSSAAKTSVYDPSSSGWIAAPNMRIARGYQSTATCSDGRIFNIGGSWSGVRGGKDGEIYDPSSNTWSLLSGALVSPMLTADAGGVWRSDNHAWLFGWKNKTVFQVRLSTPKAR